MTLGAEVLDDRSRSIKGDKCGDVVEGRVAGQSGLFWRSEKLLVCGLESHYGSVGRIVEDCFFFCAGSFAGSAECRRCGQDVVVVVWRSDDQK